MKRISIVLCSAAAASLFMASMVFTAETADKAASPIYGVTIPAGYRHWELIAPSREQGSFDELRGILGNDIAIRASELGKLPFPDGTILVKVAWKQVPSARDDAALGHRQAFVPGHPTTVQVMVKDSKKYPSSGGWRFGGFING